MYLLIAYLSTCSDHDYWWVIKFAVIWTDWDGIYWWIYWLPNALSCYSLAYIGRTKMGLRELVCVGPKKQNARGIHIQKAKYTQIWSSVTELEICVTLAFPSKYPTFAISNLLVCYSNPPAASIEKSIIEPFAQNFCPTSSMENSIIKQLNTIIQIEKCLGVI